MGDHADDALDDAIDDMFEALETLGDYDERFEPEDYCAAADEYLYFSGGRDSRELIAPTERDYRDASLSLEVALLKATKKRHTREPKTKSRRKRS